MTKCFHAHPSSACLDSLTVSFCVSSQKRTDAGAAVSGGITEAG